jgi:hypothetical protein
MGATHRRRFSRRASSFLTTYSFSYGWNPEKLSRWVENASQGAFQILGRSHPSHPSMTARRMVVCALASCALWSTAPALVGAQAAEEQYFLEQANQAMPARARRQSDRRSDGDAQGQLGTREMRQANSVASQLVRRRLRSSRPQDLELLENAREAEVIVIRGTFDRVQDVLVALETDHVVLPPRLINQLPLMSTQTVMVNCPGGMSRAGVEKLRRFVETGGFLVTTDWALRLASRAFPETIRRGGRDTGNDVVPVEVVDQDHPFLHNVQATDDTLRWWLESSSYPIRVIDPRRVEVLLTSDVMRRRYGQAAIAVTFVEGEGRVLHTTSHFYLQQSRLSSARDRARGSAFARDLGLSDDDVEELRGRGLDDVRVGHVAGAFAMQQLISNVVITKRRENDLLLSHFQLRATGEGELLTAADGTGESVGTIKSGFLLRELETQGEMVRVRDLFGREGWVAESLIRRPSPPPEPEPEPEVVTEAESLDAETASIPAAAAAETTDAGCATSRLDDAPGAALLGIVLLGLAGRRRDGL